MTDGAFESIWQAPSNLSQRERSDRASDPGEGLRSPDRPEPLTRIAEFIIRRRFAPTRWQFDLSQGRGEVTRHVIAPVDELPPGARKFLTIDERPIAVFNINGEFFGLLNRCPHQGAALCEGPLIGLAQSSDPGEIEYTKLGEIIRCPWHGWEFDIRTGQSYCDPKRFRARAYPAHVEPGSSVVKGPYVAETLAVSVESDYVVVDL